MPPLPDTPQRAPLAVSMGDPAGIGLEIALKAWIARESTGVAPFVLFADPETVAERAHALRLSVPVEVVATLNEAEHVFSKALPVLTVALSVRSRPGAPDPANAAAVIASIERATEAVVAGEAAALVTNPIAKHILAQAGFPHPGHTEFLGALAERHYGHRFRPVMMLAAGGFRVVPLTIHCALADVAPAITRDLIVDTARIVAAALQTRFSPRRPPHRRHRPQPARGRGRRHGA